MDGLDVDEATSDAAEEVVGAAGGADVEGGAAEALEVEPPLANERAGVAARLRVVEPPENLDEELVGKTSVDPIMPSHCCYETV